MAHRPTHLRHARPARLPGGRACWPARGVLASCLGAAFALAVLVLGAPPAAAQTNNAPLGGPVVDAPVPAPKAAQTPLGLPGRANNSDQPMLLQADEMIYDNQNNTVVARGNVEIYWNNYTLLADQVTYDQNANTLAAEGNVRIKEPDGALIQADRITLTDDFRDGFLRSLRIVTQDDSRIAAAQAIREEGETTIFESAVYTPCKPCEANPDAPPTWRIKAARVIHRKTEATITYENAWFEFLGQPIAWVPWFQHADPSVKRKSGFLIPRLRSSTELGFAMEVPYYFALAPNYDFTFSPVFTEKQGVLWAGKWRHRTLYGRYYVELAGIDETDPKDTAPAGPFRGSIKTKGEFDINELWNWGWDVTVDSDDTFRRFYGLDNILKSDRISQVYLTGLGDRSYFDARVYHFNGLLAFDDSTSNYQVHPIIDYNYVGADPVLGGEFSFNSNVMSLSREDGADSNRLITEVNWRRQYVDGLGQVLTPFAGARGDVYRVSNVVDSVTGVSYGDETITRGTALVGGEYRYPFVAHGRSADHVIEPIAQFIVRPSIGNQSDIPNEDARSLVFDDTLLFDIDKFSGYDRIESGTRANVGVRYTLQRYLGGYLQAVFGQSFQVAGDNDFPTDSGLDTNSSDYVSGVYFEPSPYLGFIAQARFNEDSFDLKRTDLATLATYGPFAGKLGYANLAAQPGLGIVDDREEIQSEGSVLLTKFWSLIGNIRYDLQSEQTITDAIGLRYADDCFALSVVYQESFIRDQDIEPDKSIMFQFQFKNLGTYSIEAEPSLSPNSNS